MKPLQRDWTFRGIRIILLAESSERQVTRRERVKSTRWDVQNEEGSKMKEDGKCRGG